MTNKMPYAAMLLASSLILSCGGGGTPSDPFDVGIARTVTMEAFDRSVPGGGEVVALSIDAGNMLVAVVDNEIVRIDLEGDFELIDAEGDWRWVSGTPNSGVLGVEQSRIAYWPAGSSSPLSTPIESTAAGEDILDVRGAFSLDGSRGVVTVVSNEPRTRAWYTIDGGVSWERLLFVDGKESLRLRGDVAFLPDGTLLAASADGIYAADEPGGVWTERTRTVPNRGIALLVTSSGDLYRYSPAEGGLALSTDGGRSFTDVWFNALAPFFVEVRQTGGGELLALANRTNVGGTTPLERPMGLYRSTDGGRSWVEEMQVSATSLAVRGSSVAIGLVRESIPGVTHPGGILLSVDRGNVWEGIGRGTGVTGEEVSSFAFVGGDLLIAANGGIYRNSTLRLRFVSAPFGMNWIAGDGEGGVWWNTGQRTFRRDNTGVIRRIDGIEAGAVPVGLRDGGLLLIGSGRIDRYDTASGLTTVSDDPPVLDQVVEVTAGLLAAVAEDGTSLRSTDGGASWVPTGEPVVVACNSVGGCVAVIDDDYYLIPADSATASPLRFDGLPGSIEDIARVSYGPLDRIWVLMKGGQLLASDAQVR